MKMIIVSGIPQIDRSTMIEVTLKRLSLPKSDMDFIDLDENSQILRSILSSEDLTMYQIGEMTKQINSECEHAIIKKMKTCNGVLIVNCSLTIHTKFGIFPVLKKDFFETFSPDLLLLVEKPPIDVSKKEKEIKLIEKHQKINEIYAFTYSALTHSVVDRIVIKGGKLDEAVRLFTASIKSII
ncbi:MAG: hypothetical protein GXO64_04105 [Candidatus Micrarchaeota archaeon]|nr:hypothetical protein [Candidatus Micrarchaeota archaeon]